MAGTSEPAALPMPSEEDPVTVREDTLPQQGWTATATGSVSLGSEGVQARHASFVVRALGSKPAARRDRIWAEIRQDLGRTWPDEAGTWSLQAHAAPLVGVEQVDSSGTRLLPLLRWREGWLRAAWSNASRWELTLGSAASDPGTGLAFHPTRVLPWRDPGIGPQEPEARSPLGIGVAGSWGTSQRTGLQVWPTLRTAGMTRNLAEPQEFTVRAEHALRPFEDHHLQLVAGAGSVRSFGAGWEWMREGWYLSAAGAWRNDGHPLTGTGACAPHLAVQLQRDVPAPLLGQMRLSGEWAFQGSGWSAARARREAARIDSLASVPATLPQAGLARQELGRIATNLAWIDAYAQRILLRIGSAESLRWGGGLDLLLVGPQDGAVLRLLIQRSFGAHLEADAELTGIAWCRPASLLAQMPVARRGRLGLRWNW